MKLAAFTFAIGLAATSAGAQPADLAPIFATYTAQTPGCAVGVRQGDSAPVLRGFGMADLEHGAPITPETVFEAGSVSKQFTAAAILLLVEDGKLSLSDDIRKHVPEMPDYGRPITVDMLLSHTSGLRDWGEVMDLAGWPRTSRVYTGAEVLQIAARQKALNYAPGEAYSYTNTGYNLAALIVQRLSGYSLADFTKLRIFEPLGMAHTSWRDNFRRVVPGRAIAYGPGPGGFGQDMPFENTYGHGALLTTVGDLLIWNEALTAGKLGGQVSARLKERATLTGGRRITYARGLTVQSRDGREEIAHSGATAGYRAWLARYPAERLSVAVLCNRADANAVMLGRRVVDATIPPPTRPAPAARPTPAADLASAPGLYVDERTGGVLRLAADATAIRVLGGPGLIPAAEAGRYEAGGMDFAFTPEGVLRSGPDGEATTFRRVQPAQPTRDELVAVAGAYSSPEAGAVLNVGVRGGVLTITPADRPSQTTVALPLHRDAFQAGVGLVRVIRGADGRVEALRFSGPRVYALDFRRVPGS